jgi:hypothetical protein
MSEQERVGKANAKLRSAYRKVFSDSPETRLVLTHLLKQGQNFGTPFVAGDPHSTAFNAGRQHLVSSIFAFLNRDPLEMLRQYHDPGDMPPLPPPP